MKTLVTFCLVTWSLAVVVADAATSHTLVWSNYSSTPQNDGLPPNTPLPGEVILVEDGIRRGTNTTALPGTGTGWGSYFSQTSQAAAITANEFFTVTIRPGVAAQEFTLKSLHLKLKTTEAVYNTAEIRYLWQYRITTGTGENEPFTDIGQPLTLGPTVAAWSSAGNVVPALAGLDEANRIVPRAFRDAQITLRLVIWREAASPAAFPVSLGYSTQAMMVSYLVGTSSPADRALARSEGPFVPGAYLNEYTAESNALGGPSILSIPYPSETDPNRRRLIAAYQQQGKGSYIYTSNTNGSSWNASLNHLGERLGGTFLKIAESPSAPGMDAALYPWSSAAEFADRGTIVIKRSQLGSGQSAIRTVETTTDDGTSVVVSKATNGPANASPQIRETFTVTTPVNGSASTSRVTITTTPVLSGADITPVGGMPSPVPVGPNIDVQAGAIFTTQPGVVVRRETLRLTSANYTSTITEEFSSIAGTTLIMQAGPTAVPASGQTLTSAYPAYSQTSQENYLIGNYSPDQLNPGVSLPLGLGRLFAAPKPSTDLTGDPLTIYYLGTGSVRQGNPLVTVLGLVISKSTDSGSTWSEPAMVLPGEWDPAATNVWMPASGTHVYTVGMKRITTDLKPGTANLATQQVTVRPADAAPSAVGILAPILLRAAVDSDLTLPASWSESTPLTFAGDPGPTGPTASLPPLLPGYRENFGATRSDTAASYVAGAVFPAVTPAYPALHQFGVPFFPQTFPYRANSALNNASPAKSTIEVATPIGWLEGHVVQLADSTHALHEDTATSKTYHLFLRTTTGKTNYAALAKVVEQGTTSGGTWQPGAMTTSLVKSPAHTVGGSLVPGKHLLFLPFPGGHQRFHVLYDPPDSNVPNSGYYWMVGAQPVTSLTRFDRLPDTKFNSALQHRHRLVLHFSKNMIDWCFAGVVDASVDPQHSRSEAGMAFHGNDLVMLARSADHNTSSAHDNNMITFHRVQNFRALVY